MVQMMSSFCTSSSSSPDKKPGDVVKLELEQEEKEDGQLGRLHKRLKLEPRLQNLLEEPSPLGLRLKKSPSFLDLIQMQLSQQKNKSKDQKGGSTGAGAANEKIKASNFPASLLKIGTWEYKSRYEGDLVAKCYFAKHKLVWEVLDGGLKNKIEIQWSDIVAIKANFPDDDGLETLDVVLARQPLFFRETNPQPRKHTLWQATSDFTGGQASINRRHFLQCQRGFMAKHFEKLTQCDPRLSFLSQQPEILLESPYFEQVVSGMSECDEASKGTNLNAEVHSSSKNNECQDFMETSPEIASQETSAPSTAAPEIAEIKKATKRELGLPSYWEQMKVPGLQPSMSMSDLVKQIGHHFSEQMTAIPLLSSCDLKTSDILEGITQYLLSDSQQMSTLDQQPLLSKVNSLACLLQRSSQTVQYLPENGQSDLDFDHDKTKSVFTTEVENKPVEVFPATEGESSYLSGSKQELGMPRNDSVGELLLNLPRITSLPQFLHNM